MRLDGSRVLVSVLLLAVGTWACGPEPTDFGPPPPNMTTGAGGQASGSGSGSSAGSETTGAGMDMGGGCDPLADPADECGDDMRCDLATLTCVDADGDVDVDGSCASTDECLPGLACYLGFCADLCDDGSEDDEQCEVDELCVSLGGDVPGLCAQSCLLATQNCDTPGQACNRGSQGGELVAVCTGNTGVAEEGEACSFDDDCAPGFLCTPAAAHSVECVGGASACCSVICELGVEGCFGAEMGCVELLIPGQEEAGYCGV